MGTVGPIYVPVDHHTVACEVEFRGERISMERTGHVRKWWCTTHNQWTYNFGVCTEVTWPDGSASRLP